MGIFYLNPTATFTNRHYEVIMHIEIVKKSSV